MIFDESNFIYGDFNSSDYGLVFAHIDTSDFEDMSGSIELNTTFNKRDRRRSLIGYNYSDSALSFEVEIVKHNCDGKTSLTREETKAIEKSLFNRSGFKKLFIVSDDITESVTQIGSGENVYKWTDPEKNEVTTTCDYVDKRLFLCCVFVNPVRITDASGDTIGYSCTVECDSNMFTQEKITHVVDTFEDSDYFEFEVDSSEDEFIYPKVTIITGTEGGDIEICNESDDSDRVTKFIDIPKSTTLVTDGNYNYIYPKNYYDAFSEYNFIRLVPGTNVLKFTGDLFKVIIAWNNKRFII